MKDKESFVFHKDWYEALKDLDDKLRLEVYDATMQYAFYGEKIEVSPSANVALRFILPHLERDIEKYKIICERRKLSGSQGGIAKGSKCKQMLPNATKCYQKLASVADSDSDNDILDSKESLNINKEKETIVSSKKEKSFVPPTVEEVAKYIKEKDYHFSAQNFVDYYEADDWHYGVGSKRKKIANWKRCCSIWEEKSEKDIPEQQPIEDELPAGITQEKWDAFMSWCATHAPRLKDFITPIMFLKMKANVRHVSKIMCDILQDINNSQYEGDILNEFIRISQTPEIRKNFSD